MKSSKSEKKQNSEKKHDSKKILLTVLITAVVIGFLGISAVKLADLRKTNAELEARLERLEELLAEEEERSAELEEEAVYVQTQEYIEEKARSIGYVYPDEIIFRQEEE